MSATEWRFPDADRFMRHELAKGDGSYQRRHLEIALTYVTDFSCAIDGGAHVGVWTRLLSEQFDRVLAVEPAEDTYQALEQNMLAFGCQNVECKHCALGAEHGMVEMAPLEPRQEARKNTGARFVRPGRGVLLVPIDSWNLESVGFIKLDVEGSELQAIKGGAETVRRCEPIVLFEAKGFGKRYGEADDAVPVFLRALGYEALAKVGDDHIWGMA